MKLPRSKQGLAVIRLPRFRMKLPTRDGHSNVEGKFVMFVPQLTSST